MTGNDAQELDQNQILSSPIPNEEIRRYFEENPGDETARVDDIALLRAQTREVGLKVRGSLDPIGECTDVVLNGVAVRTYRPASVSRPELAVIWIHGGGWMHGDLDVYEEVARALANALGCKVLAVDYALAPEHPFPNGLNDVWEVIRWSVDQFQDVIVAGDSSGANLAAAAAIKARDSGIRLAAQLLIYPVLDSSDTEFKRHFRTRYSPFLNQHRFGHATYDRIRWIWDVYVPDAELRQSPLATPMRAATLGDVAPAVIITAEHDILRGEAEAYAARLQDDAVPVELINFSGQIHGFIQMRGVLSEAPTALQIAAAAVDRLIERGHGQ